MGNLIPRLFLLLIALPMAHNASAQFGSRVSAKDFDSELETAGNTTVMGFEGYRDATLGVNVLLMADTDKDKVFAYNRDTKARIASLDINTSPHGNNSLRGMWRDPTNGDLYVADDADDKIYAYDSSGGRLTAKDFNTLQAAGNTRPLGLWSDGTTMWVSDWEDNKIYAYNLASKQQDTSKEFSSAMLNISSPRGIWSDGKTLWVMSTMISAYDLRTKARTSHLDITPDAANNQARGDIWSDGTTLWTTQWSDAGFVKVFAYSMMSGFCQRNTAVRDAIVSAISGVTNCANVTEANLAAVTTLNMSGTTIVGSVHADDFAGLDSLETLRLDATGLTSLPDDIFAGLGSLKSLNLNSNSSLGSLQADLFAGLVNLEGLYLSTLGLTSVSENLLAGLVKLKELTLSGNNLPGLPDGFFQDISGLTQLHLGQGSGAANTFFFTPILERTDTALLSAGSAVSLRMRVKEGAPLAITATWTATGDVQGNATGTLTVGRGDLTSDPFTVQLSSMGNDVTVALSGVRVTDAGEFISDNQGNFQRFNLSPVPAAQVAEFSFTVAPQTIDTFEGHEPTYVVTAPMRPSGDVTVAVASSDTSVATVLPAVLTFTADDSMPLSQTVTITIVDDNMADSPARTAMVTHTVTGASGFEIATDIDSVTLNVSDAADGPVDGFCDRTPAVRDAIVAAIDGVTDCGDVRPSHLAAIVDGLAIIGNTSVQSGDFDGLDNLVELNLNGKQLTSLPADVFAGLGSLRILWLFSNQLTSLPPDVFAGLNSLTTLWLHNNQLTSLPEGVFAGLTNLEHLTLGINQLTSLPAGVFAGLTNLENLTLGSNPLTSLPPDTFQGIDKLTDLTMPTVNGNAFPFTASLERADSDTLSEGGPIAFRLRVAEGAPLPVTANWAARGVNNISDSSGTVTMNAGEVLSSPFTLTHTQGSETVTVSLTGGSFNADEDTDDDSGDFRSFTLAAPSTRIDMHVFEVRFDPEDKAVNLYEGGDATYIVAALRNPVVDSVVVAVASSDTSVATVSPATLTFTAANFLTDQTVTVTGVDDTMPDSPVRTAMVTHTVTEPNDVVIVRALGSLTATVDDISRGPVAGFCDRTPDVQAAILTAIPGVTNCANVLPAHLAAVTTLRFDHFNVDLSSVKSGDFAGMDGLETLRLDANGLTSLPADIFAGLGSLKFLTLSENQVAPLPAGLFAGLTNLETLWLINIGLTSLPAGLFSDLTSLTSLKLNFNQLTSLPDSTFEGISFEGVSGSFAGLDLRQGNDDRVLFFTPILERTDTALLSAGSAVSLRMRVKEGAPLAVEATWTATGDVQGTATGSLRVEPGDVTSDAFTVQLSQMGSDVTIALSNVRFVGAGEHVSDDDGQFQGFNLSPVPDVELAEFTLAIVPQMLDTFEGLTLTYTVTAPTRPSSDVTVAVASSDTSVATVSLDMLTFTADESMPVSQTVTVTAVDDNVADSPMRTAMVTHTVTGASGFDITTALDSMTVNVDDISKGPVAGFCDRTPEVQASILAEIDGVDDCEDVTVLQLAAITVLRVTSTSITTLLPGDFAGLDGLEVLDIGLNNQLTSLPAGVFDGLDNLRELFLNLNQLASLPAGVFDGLTNLVELTLDRNQLTSLPADVFADLDSLKVLRLFGNPLTSLPPGTFQGIDTLTDLRMPTVDGGAFPFTASLERADSDLLSEGGPIAFRLRVAEGAPLPVTANWAARGVNNIFDSTGTVTMNAGEVLSSPFTLTHTQGSETVTVNLTGSSFDADEDTDDADGDFRSFTLAAPSPRIDMHVFNVRFGAEEDEDLEDNAVNLYEGSEETYIVAALRNPVVDSVVVTVASSDTSVATVSPATLTFTAANFLTDQTVTVTGVDDSIPGSSLRTAMVTHTVTEPNDIVIVPALDSVTVNVDDISRGPVDGFCDRTPEVVTAILAAIDGVDDCEDVTVPQLAAITTTLNVTDTSITTLLPGDFDGLDGLKRLAINFNSQLTSLPSGVFDGLSSLEELHLNLNELASLPADVFAGLTSLKLLELSRNQLASLPADVFAGLSNLEELDLRANPLTSLPPGIFQGIDTLTALRMPMVDGGAFPFTASLERADSDLLSVGDPIAFRLRVAEGAPVPVTATWAARGVNNIFDSTGTVTMNAGEVLSSPFTLTHTRGSETVTVSLTGRSFDADEDTDDEDADFQSFNLVAPSPRIEMHVFEVRFEAAEDEDLEDNAVNLYEGRGATYTVKALRNPLVGSVVVAVASSDTSVATVSPATLTFTAANFLTGLAVTVTGVDDSIPGSSLRTAMVTHRVTESNDIVIASALDSVTVNVDDIANLSFCDRTPKVQEAILAEIDGVDDCNDVTDTHLAGITGEIEVSLGAGDPRILQPGDFTGLVNLERLILPDNQLTSLSAGLFDGLVNLNTLHLQRNQLTTLPLGLFTDLGNLETLRLEGNQLTSLPVGVFAGLDNLNDLALDNNQLTTLTPGLFANLGKVQFVNLNQNQWTTLPPGAFAGLDSVTLMYLRFSPLTTLPPGVFAGLGKLEEIQLHDNQLRHLPPGVFDGLDALIEMNLENNQLTTLAPGVFAGLDKVTDLGLSRNQLSSLPAGAFAGLSSLPWLQLHDNQLTTLTPGVFDGLDNLKTLWLHNNQLTTLPPNLFQGVPLERLVMSLEIGGDPAFLFTPVLERTDSTTLSRGDPVTLQLRIVEGTPLPVTATWTATGVQGTSTGNLMVEAGGVTSDPFTLTPTGGTPVSVTLTVAFDVDEGTDNDGGLGSYSGFDLAAAPDVTLSEFSVTVSPQTLDVPERRSVAYTVTAPMEPSGDVIIAVASDDTDVATVFPPTLTFTADNYATAQRVVVTGVDDNTADSPGRMATVTHTMTGAGPFDITTDIDSVAVTVDEAANVGFCGRTQQVQDAILADIDGVTDCADVTAEHLLGITSLGLAEQNISLLQIDDFSGLDNLGRLRLNGNQLTSLPAGMFRGLSNLRWLYLYDNRFSSLPADVFRGADSLTYLWLSENQLTSLPANVFSRLNLEWLYLGENQLTSLPANVFSGMSNLTTLGLDINQLTSLPANVFSGLSNLSWLQLEENQLVSLPANVFSGLSNLGTLRLQNNQLTRLPARAFAGLKYLKSLNLEANELTGLPARALEGVLGLDEDDPDKPHGLEKLFLGQGLDYTGTIFFTPSLERTDDNAPLSAGGSVSLRMRVAEGAPLPVTATWTATGGVQGTATGNLRVEPGDVTSDPFTVQLGQPLSNVVVSLSNVAFDVAEPTDDIGGGVFQGFDLAAAPDLTVSQFSITVSSQTLEISEGDMATYTVMMSLPPSDDVTVAVASDDVSVAAVVQPTLTFTAANYATAQTVTVTTTDDFLDNLGDRLATVTHTASGAAEYAALAIDSVAVTVADDETAGISASRSSVRVPEGNEATWTLTMDSRPRADVTVMVAKIEGGDEDLSVTPATLTFPVREWRMAQTVTVTAAEDEDRSGGRATFRHTVRSGDPQYSAIEFNVRAIEADSEAPVVGGGSIPNGPPVATAVAFAFLAAQDFGEAAIDLGEHFDDAEDLDAFLDFAFDSDGSTSLTTAVAQYTIAGRTLTISSLPGVNGAESIVIRATDLGGLSATKTLAVTVGETGRQVAVAPDAIAASENGGAATYTVALLGEPSGDVTVTPASGDAAVATVSEPLTFTPDNWTSPQAVTVTGADDNFDNVPDRTATVTHTISGGDYDDVEVPDVTFTATDDEPATPGVEVADGGIRVSVAGAPGTATVALGDSGATLEVTAQAGIPQASQGSGVRLPPPESIPAGAEIAVTFGPLQDPTDDSRYEFGAGVDVAVSGLNAPVTVCLPADGLTGDGRDPLLLQYADGWSEVPGGVYDSDTMEVCGETQAGGSFAAAVPGHNDAPTATAAAFDFSADEDFDAATRDLGDHFDDTEDADSDLTFTFSDGSTTQETAVAQYSIDGQTLTIAPVADASGEEIVTVRATDTGGLFASKNLVVTVTAVNDPPVAMAGADQTVNNGDTVTLDGSGSSDPEGDTLTYGWTQTGGAQVTLSDSSSATPTFTAPDESSVLAFTLTVTDSGGATASDEVAVTVRDIRTLERTDRVNRAILPLVARAMTDSAVTTIKGRLDTIASPDGCGSAPMSVAGLLGFSDGGDLAANLGTSIAEDRDLMRMFDGRTLSMPLGERNRTSGCADGAIWATVDYTSLNAESSDTLDWDGELRSIHLGADMRLGEGLVAGLTLVTSEGDFDFTDRFEGTSVAGDYETGMTSVNPYVSLKRDDGLSLWAVLGYGQGDMEIDDEAGVRDSDMDLLSAAIGGSGSLLSGSREGADLRLKLEAMATRVDVDGSSGGATPELGVLGLEVDALRLRLAVEGHQRIELKGGSNIAMSAELGVRQDSGDGLTGEGVEFGGSLNWSDPSLGLTVGWRGRTLLTHNEDYNEWGMSGMVKLDRTSGGRGLALSLESGWGDVASGVDRVWRDGFAHLGDSSGALGAERNRGPSLDAQISYGFTVKGMLMQPYGNYGAGPGGSRRYSLGNRVDVGIGKKLGIGFDRRERPSGEPQDGFLLEYRLSGEAGRELAVQLLRREGEGDADGPVHGVLLEGSLPLR